MAEFYLKSRKGDLDLKDGPNMVGRDRKCEIRLRGRGISRTHCRISVAAMEVKVEDLGSRNGTLVNGQPVDEPAFISPGDIVQVGEIPLTLYMQELGTPSPKPAAEIPTQTPEPTGLNWLRLILIIALAAAIAAGVCWWGFGIRFGL